MNLENQKQLINIPENRSNIVNKRDFDYCFFGGIFNLQKGLTNLGVLGIIVDS